VPDKFALLVGIDDYESQPLGSCKNDATEMKRLLSHHYDGRDNFSVTTLLSQEGFGLSRDEIVGQIGTLLQHDEDSDLLFYFSGHGDLGQLGPELVTQEDDGSYSAISMDQLAAATNRAPHRSVTIILDCCFAGAIGHLIPTESGKIGQIQLSRGAALLAATRDWELALAGDTNSRFTATLLDGLEGAAADHRGRVTPAGLHALADASLSGVGQHEPVLKVYSDGAAVLRECRPIITPEQIALLVGVFQHCDEIPCRVVDILDPTDTSSPVADEEFASAARAGIKAQLVTAAIVGGGNDSQVTLTLAPAGRHHRRLHQENGS